MISGGESYIKLMRSEDTAELIKHPRELALLTLIAYRAKRTVCFSALGLEPGEALIGDHKSCGLTMRQYRTAKQNLEKWGFSTFKATNRGTIAKLINTNIYDINCEKSDNQGDNRPTSKRQASDKQPTTNKNGNKEKKDKLPVPKIVDYLNVKTGKAFKANSRQTVSLIKARINDGFSMEDFLKVIDNKAATWANDPKMSKFLRPETLFGTKFEAYLNENGVAPQPAPSAPRGFEL
jgi:uncharacterized phage protein (TIGR02220 family)